MFVAPEGSGSRCCPEKEPTSCYENVAKSHTWVLRFDGDPVTRTYKNFGVAPDDDDFGAIEMHTEPPQCNQSLGGLAFWDTKCHSRYFNWGQRSLDNLTAVALGRYDSVALSGKHPSIPTNLNPGARRTTWPVIGTPKPADPWDLVKDAQMPAISLLPPSSLVDGQAADIPEGEGQLHLIRTQRDGSPGVIAGVTSNDAGPLIAVVASADAGGVAWPNILLLFTPDGELYALSDFLGMAVGGRRHLPEREGIVIMELDGGVLNVYLDAVGPTDAECCPTHEALVTVVGQDRQVAIVHAEEQFGD